MRHDRLPAKSGDEQDWISRRWRRMLCVFHNRTGLGKKIKRAMNKRVRHAWKQDIEKENDDV